MMKKQSVSVEVTLPTFVALMRGINVSGQKIIKMERLRETFEEMGFSRVRTYLQSGNVVFDSSKRSTQSFSKKIEEKIRDDFGFSVPLVLRTSGEMKQIAAENPFLKEAGIDQSKLHVTFLSEIPAKTALGKIGSLDASHDQFQAKGREIYLYCPNGYGRTKLSNNAIEKLLRVHTTTRNWKSVNALAEMSAD
jgi:uncharacterized protein (DUF1697 family)